MTMAADESGQSILEFVLLSPLMLAFVLILIKTNTAIQAGIVNQQYARLQTHFMTFNSAWYPDIGFQDNLVKRKAGLFPLGISENSVDPTDVEYESAPNATLFSVARSPATEGLAGASEDPQTEDIDRRVRVRVRISSAICTPMFVLANGKPPLAVQVMDPEAERYGVAAPNALWALNEQTVPQFCAPDSTKVDP